MTDQITPKKFDIMTAPFMELTPLQMVDRLVQERKNWIANGFWSLASADAHKRRVKIAARRNSVKPQDLMNLLIEKTSGETNA